MYEGRWRGDMEELGVMKQGAVRILSEDSFDSVVGFQGSGCARSQPDWM
jgi:hypothetical protein